MLSTTKVFSMHPLLIAHFKRIIENESTFGAGAVKEAKELLKFFTDKKAILFLSDIFFLLAFIIGSIVILFL